MSLIGAFFIMFLHKNSIGHLLGSHRIIFTAPPPKKKNIRKKNDKIVIMVEVHFFFGKIIFIVCEQKNRQKNTNKCYIQHT